MVILKKVRGSTLMETMVATVLIMIIFLMASMILNNSFQSFVNGNTEVFENHLRKVEYELLHKENLEPKNETFNNWEIESKMEYSEMGKTITIESHRVGEEDEMGIYTIVYE